jgi:hypothetical protein
MELTPEDVLGLMGLRYAKCQIAPASPGHQWRMRLVLERPGHTSRDLMEYAMGSKPDPFFLACKWPTTGTTKVDFYHAYNWQVTFREELDHIPTTHFGLRGSYPGVPLKAGRWVVLLWTNITGKSGWDPDDLDFGQRIIMDLSERPIPTE